MSGRRHYPTFSPFLVGQIKQRIDHVSTLHFDNKTGYVSEI
jgi:hypothetical protein